MKRLILTDAQLNHLISFAEGELTDYYDDMPPARIFGANQLLHLSNPVPGADKKTYCYSAKISFKGLFVIYLNKKLSWK